jgi:hypothetical protein
MAATTRPGIAWERIEPGYYRSTNVSQGVFEIRRQATTHGMKRASNDMWFVYIDGERIYVNQATLADAKRKADFYARTRF